MIALPKIITDNSDGMYLNDAGGVIECNLHDLINNMLDV